MKIPKGAKRVFQGIIFDVYHWQQKMFDGSTATFEMLKRPATLQIIPTVGDKILLSYEQQPTKPLTYTLLGGRQEGEEPLITAKRELLKEAGMESEDWELLKIYQAQTKIDWEMYLFVARNCKKVTKPKLDPGEKIEVKEVGFEKFLDIVSSENFWGKDVSLDILRMRLDSKKLTKFRQKIFKKSD